MKLIKYIDEFAEPVPQYWYSYKLHEEMPGHIYVRTYPLYLVINLYHNIRIFIKKTIRKIVWDIKYSLSKSLQEKVSQRTREFKWHSEFMQRAANGDMSSSTRMPKDYQ